MKRDLDLARQLLIDLVAQGTECPVSALRPGASSDHQERVRYHLELLSDAGLVEILEPVHSQQEHLRLKNAGHELIELAASETRWREARRLVVERTGGESLTAVRALLMRWTVEMTLYTDRYAPRRSYGTYFHRVRPRHYESVEPTRSEREAIREAATPSPYRPKYLERFDWRDLEHPEQFMHESAYDPWVRDLDAPADEPQLPIHVI